ncbi:MAG: hypothetical protein P1U56_17125 [Saprospiraceae bacterium]|nr:hypothetical protein [Saprospiraceae bacterium]
MEEIIDDFTPPNTDRKYSILSFSIAIISLGLNLYLFSIIPNKLTAEQGFPEPPFMLIIAIYLFCIIGILYTLLSFIRKESSTFFKWVGAIMNLAIALILLATIVVAKII